MSRSKSEKNGNGNKCELSVWTRAITANSEWPDKEEFLDVVYWARQAIGIIVGIGWGLIPLKGFIALLLFVLVNAGVMYLYFNSFQQIDEEEYGGIWELTKEGFMTSFAGFLAKWKGLRDTFRAELKKDRFFRRSKYHRNRPVWIHFKSLQFLKEQMLPRPPIWERGKAGMDGDQGLGENDSEGMLTKNGTPLNRNLDDRDTLADQLLSMSCENGTLQIEGIDHRVDVKQEPEESFDNLEFQNVADNLANDEMMLQNISPEQVLMGESDNGTGLTVDPLEGNRFDDTYYFFMSLLPHMRNLPADRRMLLRIQMEELVYKEVYKRGSEEVDA